MRCHIHINTGFWLFNFILARDGTTAQQQPAKSPVRPPVRSPVAAEVPMRVPVRAAPVQSAPIPPRIPPMAPVRRPPVPSPTVQVGRVTGLRLVNADTNTAVANLVNGTVIAVSEIVGMSEPSFNINATVIGGSNSVQSVQFAYNRVANYSTDKNGPIYAFCGNVGSDFSKCSGLGFGNHTVTAIPYSGRGRAGTPVSIRFSIIRGTIRNRDTTPPVLITLTAAKNRNTTVDVSTGPGSIQLQIVARDDLTGIKSGLKAGYLAAYDPANRRLLANATFSVADIPVIGTPVTFNVTLQLQQTTRPGTYPLQLSLRDAVNNEIVLKSEELRAKSFLSSISVINSVFDDTPPKLIQFVATSNTTIDATSDNAAAKFTIRVQDDKSGFDFGYIQADDPTDVSYFFEASFESMTPIAGKPVDLNVIMPVELDTRPGKYNLDIYLIDTRGNFVFVTADELARRKLPNSILIVNSKFDQTPPLVLNVKALSPSRVDVSTGPASVEIQVDAKDEVLEFLLESCKFSTQCFRPLRWLLRWINWPSTLQSRSTSFCHFHRV